MSSQLPPPPRNVTNTRDMYTWLYRLYAYVTGEIGGQVMDGEAVVAATASALPLVAEQQKELQGLPLLITPDGGGEFAKELQSVQLAQLQSRVSELQKQVDALILYATPDGGGEFAKELQSVQLAQLQSRVSELQKQVDALILYATRPPQDDKFQDAVLMSGVRKT